MNPRTNTPGPRPHTEHVMTFTATFPDTDGEKYRQAEAKIAAIWDRRRAGRGSFLDAEWETLAIRRQYDKWYAGQMADYLTADISRKYRGIPDSHPVFDARNVWRESAA